MLSQAPCAGFSVVRPLSPYRDGTTQRVPGLYSGGMCYLLQVTSVEYNPEDPGPAPDPGSGSKSLSLASPSLSGTSHPSSRPPPPPYLQVVLPTPPLPPTKIHLRLRCSMMLLSVGSSGSTSGASSNSSASTPHPATPAAILEPAHVIKRSAPRKAPTGEIPCHILNRASGRS